MNSWCVDVSTGTIWTQNIITLMYESEFQQKNEFPNNLEKMPWLEFPEGHSDYSSRPSPRLFVSHLVPRFMPPSLRDRKAKVNLKDQCVYHVLCEVCVCV